MLICSVPAHVRGEITVIKVSGLLCFIRVTLCKEQQLDCKYGQTHVLLLLAFRFLGSVSVYCNFSPFADTTFSSPVFLSIYSAAFFPSFCPQDLIDRLIVINSNAKIHSLFNYEQSHTFGLR